MVGVFGAGAPSGVQGRSSGEESGGGKAPRSWRLYCKINVQFLALAYTNMQIAVGPIYSSCKVFYSTDRAEIAQL